MARFVPSLVFSSLLLGVGLYAEPSTAETADSAIEQDRLLLQLLSCQLPWSKIVSPSLPVGRAIQRMEALGELAAAGGTGDKIIAGPLRLRGTCLQNVHFAGAAGSFWVRGQVCEQSIDDFLQKLSDIGMQLNSGKLPPSLSSRSIPDSPSRYWGGTDRQFYLLANGRIELAKDSLRLEAGPTPSYFCMLRPPAEHE